MYLEIHQRNKFSSKSLKGPAGIALPGGGDAYWFLVHHRMEDKNIDINVRNKIYIYTNKKEIDVR